MAAPQEISQVRVKWQRRINKDDVIAGVRKKIQDKTATYADAQQLAIRAGEHLKSVLKEEIPGALQDGHLYEELADELIRKPMKDAYKLVSDNARDVQAILNEKAGIHIKPQVAPINKDQVDGIIHGITSADEYQHYEASFLDQVANFAEGVVDDAVRANAHFAYKAGLEPVIVRISDGKCCEWCSALAGTYIYENVKNKGNDVFRRHRNCHCQILYDPRDGTDRRQDVRTRVWSNT